MSLDRYALDLLTSEVLYHTERVAPGENPDPGAQGSRIGTLLRMARQEYEGTMEPLAVYRQLILRVADIAAMTLVASSVVVNQKMAELDPDADQPWDLDLKELLVHIGEIAERHPRYDGDSQ